MGTASCAVGVPASQILAPRTEELGGKEYQGLPKASSGDERERERGSRLALDNVKVEGELLGVSSERLEKNKAGTNCEREKRGAERRGVSKGSRQDAAPARSAEVEAGEGVPAVPLAKAGRAAVTSCPGPLPLAGWVGPRRAERARGQGGGRGGAGMNVSV